MSHFSLHTIEADTRIYRVAVDRLLLFSLAASITCLPLKVICQTPTTATDSGQTQRMDHRSILYPIKLIGALGVAAVLDRPDRSALRERGSDGSLIHALSVTGNALGTANHLVPALAAAYVFTQIRGTPNGPPDVLDAAIGYAASDLAAGAIRWAVGRERPFVHGDPERFHPFTTVGNYHSFPSGHVTHIMAIATAAAMESHSAWIRDAAIGTVGLVAWQRIHADQHWTSDVVGAAIISNLLSRTLVTKLRERRNVH